MIFTKRKENEILKNILNTSNNLSNSLQNLLGFEKKKKRFMCFDENPC